MKPTSDRGGTCDAWYRMAVKSKPRAQGTEGVIVVGDGSHMPPHAREVSWGRLSPKTKTKYKSK